MLVLFELGDDRMELLEIINELVVKNIDESIRFYTNYFNFEVIETDGNPITWAKLKKDNCTIMLENYETVCKEIENYPAYVATSNLIKFRYINKEEILKLYNKFLNDNIKLFMKLKETDY